MRRLHCWGALFGAALLLLPTSDVAARKKKGDAEEAADTGKSAAEKAVTVVTKDKVDLRAEGSDLAKVLKHLKKKEKLEYVSRSADGKWVQVRKGKVEGWVSADILEGLPAADGGLTMAAVGAGGDKPSTDTKTAAADPKPAASDGKTTAAKPPEKAPEPAAAAPAVEVTSIEALTASAAAVAELVRSKQGALDEAKVLLDEVIASGVLAGEDLDMAKAMQQEASATK